VVAWSLLAFEHCADVDRIVLVVRKDQVNASKSLARMFGISKMLAIVPGGTKRQDSVMNGLKALDIDARIVVVHDGARPCVTPETISETVKLARRGGAAVVGRRIWDTVKFVEKGTTVTRTEDRSKLWAVQTPQAFDVRLIKRAYEAVAEQKKEVTDDASAVELLGETVKIYETEKPNLKITTVEDLRLAASIMLK
jgi:2-C-methyl-D-erythritol 4-phosphate cytidylyltransferase